MSNLLRIGAIGSVLALAGCGGGAGDANRADKVALQVDQVGCPDLSGAYAFNMPGERGVSYRGSMLLEFPVEDGNRVPAAQISGLIVQRKAHGLYDWRFLIDEARVMQQLGVIREFDKPRYREWYHLLNDPGRAAYVARNGEAAHARRVAELGPRSEIVRTLRAGSEMVCRDGWLELPREYAGPIRLTRGEDGSIIGESHEISTVGVTVWCGDGCRDLPIPTGKFTGRLQWPRSDGLQAWKPDDMRGRYVFQRPIDEIEAETAALKAGQARSDALRYASAGTIRTRIEALAPAGTVVDEVAVRDGKVHVGYTAPVADQDRLLTTISEVAGDRRGPQEVRRIVRSGHFDVRRVEFALTDSPLVLRDAPYPTPQTRAAEAEPGTASRMAVLALAEPEAPKMPPAGFAELREIRRRIGPLFPSGTRIIDARYGGGNVIVVGEADSNRSVSDGLRAIAGQGSTPELVRIETTPAGRMRFEILLRRSALVSE